MKKRPRLVSPRKFTPSASFLLAHPCLTLRQPHAEFVFSLGKDMENRSWQTKHRGPLLIHAGLARTTLARRKVLWSDPGFEDFDFDALAYGAVIGVVDVVDCVSKSKSQWFRGPNALVLANPRLFTRPIPKKGTLGMFHFRKSDLPRGLK